MQFTFRITLSSLLIAVSSGCVTPDAKSITVAAPPRECLISRSAFCIEGGPLEIVMQRANQTESPGFNFVWILRGDFRPESKFVLFEPDGCKDAFSDTLVALAFDERVIWRDREWDRMRVRLKSDGSCDIEMLVPLFNGDPMEWAYTSGVGGIRACNDARCTGRLLADLRDQFNPRFKRAASP